MNPQELLFKLNKIHRIAIIAGVAVLFLFLFYFFVVSDSLDTIGRLNQEITRLKTDIKNEQNTLKQGPTLKAKIEELKKKLQTMVAGLPEKQDIEQLLQTISQLLSQSNLEAKRFVPGKEQVNTELYYAMIPIQLQVRGIYERQGAFLAGLNGLPRIVNVPDVVFQRDGAVTPTEKKLGVWPLDAQVTANTYRRLSQEEIKRVQEQAKAKPAVGGARPPAGRAAARKKQREGP